MSNEVYTTAQAAEFLGISTNNLRVWKSRKSDQLIEGTHWVTGDNNQVFWTPIGLEVLQQIKGATACNADITDDVIDPLQETVTQPLHQSDVDPLRRYSSLINAVADAITPGLMQRIDNAVTGRVKTAIATPMSPTECVTLLTELGLKPCNPELLLSGNQPNLLTESKEN
ncbi:hypothetical protein Cri9333_4985 (plasmid) [Crinalium epipsammum PCC 9333]|uniref:Uncharacterized protein n=1 Tax=Crinalium epipsammum PCC 9333 TaxID=1173022 RepID=K9W8D3_9CYAN|nr:hypothetical protein [Crinalium epipsammum]AFZ15740.1 hypothetical protein Cri9333_4985 [Crinalium epipsammum PCC 9333]